MIRLTPEREQEIRKANSSLCECMIDESICVPCNLIAHEGAVDELLAEISAIVVIKNLLIFKN